MTACSDFRRNGFTRRNLLSAGGMGFLGLSLPAWLRAKEDAGPERTGKTKSVIFLYQFGGPSHIDTIDPKPDAPAETRGEFKSIPTSLTGVRFGEHLPRLAKWADRMALVRSVHHGMKNHNTATYYNLTGRNPPIDDIRLRDSPELFPAYGSVVSRLRPAREGIPGFVALPHVMADGVVSPGQHASFLGRVNDPFLIKNDPSAADFRLPELSLPAEAPFARMEDRRELLKVIDRQAGLMDWCASARSTDTYHGRAFSMLGSPAVKAAFDISAEPAKLRDRYGRTAYGQSCLLARRLVEAGVEFANVYFSNSIGSAKVGGWDTHAENFAGLKDRLLPITDQTVPTLLEDLESRGLLKDTMVVWMGEFGRSPKIVNTVQFGPNGRDHWPQCYSMFFAGGGVKPGVVYGASDKIGGVPADNPVKPDDIAATIYASLGLSPETEIMDLFNRPHQIALGKPITDILA